MKRFVSLLLVISFFAVFGCAGRNPELIAKKTDQDDKMVCATLLAEINGCESCIFDKYHAGKTATEKTIALAIVGYVLFPPVLFAMDLKKADYKEMGAYQERRNHLITLAKAKNCAWYEKEETDDELMTLAENEHLERKKKEMKERELQEQKESGV